MIWLKKILYFLSNAFRLQLFLNLFILPVFWYWSLPVSLVNPISNIFFAPFLSLFLIVSSAIFFTEILSIPNSVIIHVLELITSVWIWLTSKLSFNCSFLFSKPSWPYTIVILTLGVFCIKHKNLQKNNRSLKSLLILWLILILSNYAQPLKHGIYFFDRKKNKSIIFSQQNNEFLILKNEDKQNWYSNTHEIIERLIKINVRNLKKIIIIKLDLISLRQIIQIIKNIKTEEVLIPGLHRNFNREEFNLWLHFIESCKKDNIQLTEIKSSYFIGEINNIHKNSISLAIYPIKNFTKNYLSIVCAFGERIFTA